MSNFQKRVISSVIGGALMIGLILIGGELLLAALCVVSLVGYFELTKACKVHEENKKANGLEIVGICATVIWYLLIELSERNILKMDVRGFGFVVMVLSLIAFMAVYVFTFPRFNAEQTMAAYFSFVYCPVMISFIYMTRVLDLGVYLVWMIYVCSWFCDIFAYLVGVKLGKHKFVPKLSPKKSTEGAIGGVVGAAVIGGLYAVFILAPHISSRSTGEVVAVIVVFSMIGALISMVGDLAASAIKRNHNIKDYGNVIPGHGGIMDRFDSVIIVAPLVYLLSTVFLTFIGA